MFMSVKVIMCILVVLSTVISSFKLRVSPNSLILNTTSSISIYVILRTWLINTINILQVARLLAFPRFDFISLYGGKESAKRTRALMNYAWRREFHGTIFSIRKLVSCPALADYLLSGQRRYYGDLFDVYDGDSIQAINGEVCKCLVKYIIKHHWHQLRTSKIFSSALHQISDAAWLYDLLKDRMTLQLMMHVLRTSQREKFVNMFVDDYDILPDELLVRAILVLLTQPRWEMEQFLSAKKRFESLISIEGNLRTATNYQYLLDVFLEIGLNSTTYWETYSEIVMGCSRTNCVPQVILFEHLKRIVSAIPNYLTPSASCPIITLCARFPGIDRIHLLHSLPLYHHPRSLWSPSRKAALWIPSFFAYPTVEQREILVNPFTDEDIIAQCKRSKLPYLPPTIHHNSNGSISFFQAVLNKADDILVEGTFGEDQIAVIIAAWTILITYKQEMDFSPLFTVTDSSWEDFSQRICEGREACEMRVKRSFILKPYFADLTPKDIRYLVDISH